MADFSKFAKQMAMHIEKMANIGPLFVVDITKDDLWSSYLDAFPEGTNNVYKERREYDCNCCRQFIKAIGAVIAIRPNGERVSIWDVTANDYYVDVCVKMSELIKSRPICEPFFYDERSIGTANTVQLLEDNSTKKWNHFYCATPASAYYNPRQSTSRASHVGAFKSTFDVYKRSVVELSLESAETVLELIKQNSLYRGQEFLSSIKNFVAAKQKYDRNPSDDLLWLDVMTKGHELRFRNTVIGTLLIDLSEGVELDTAVTKYEQKVAPTNYKRPTALVTQSMIDAAKKKVESLGLSDSLYRRFARTTDITVANVLFADRTTKIALDAFDELAPTKPKVLSRVEEVSVEQFMQNILPAATKVELLFEGRLQNNLVSLIAPEYPSAPNLFKWGNSFSWSYTGEVTDSIKERVKAAGGVVDADVRVSLSWFNYDDLDLSVITPRGRRIYFGDRIDHQSGGQLDIDMNAGSGRSRSAVENIFWSNMSKMPEGVYKVYVHNFSRRETIDVGFELEMEFPGTVLKVSHPDAVGSGQRVEALVFEYTRKGGIKIMSDVNTQAKSREVWGVDTEQFHTVTMIMNSPNHWDGEEVGNKHVFFMLDKCVNPDAARGFYNEYLCNDLVPHRKVFELMSSRMKAQPTNDQLSGIGFSSTQRNEVTLRVTGKTTRTIKVKF